MIGRKKPTSYETIIFDFDGTIADTFSVAIMVANKIFEAEKREPLTRKQVDELVKLGGIKEIIQKLNISRWRLPIYAYKFRKLMSEHMDDIVIFDEIEPVISSLFDRYKLGVVSSNSTENVERFLKRHGILEYFEFVDGGASVLGKHRSLRKTLHAQSLNKRTTLYIGDEVRDIEACRKVRLDIVSVAWGPTDKSRLKREKPTHLITKPKQLLKILK